MGFRFSPCEPCCSPNIILKLYGPTNPLVSQTQSTLEPQIFAHPLRTVSSLLNQRITTDKISFPSFCTPGQNVPIGLPAIPNNKTLLAGTADGCSVFAEGSFNFTFGTDSLFFNNTASTTASGQCSVSFDEVVDKTIQLGTLEEFSVNNFVLYQTVAFVTRYKNIGRDQIYKRNVTLTFQGCDNSLTATRHIIGPSLIRKVRLNSESIYDDSLTIQNSSVGYLDNIVPNELLVVFNYLGDCNGVMRPINNSFTTLATGSVQLQWSIYDCLLNNYPYAAGNLGGGFIATYRRRVFGYSRPHNKNLIRYCNYTAEMKPPYYINFIHQRYNTQSREFETFLVKKQEVTIEAIPKAGSASTSFGPYHIESTISGLDGSQTFSCFVPNEDIFPTSSRVFAILVDSRGDRGPVATHGLQLHKSDVSDPESINPANLIGIFVHDPISPTSEPLTHSDTGTGRLYSFKPSITTYNNAQPDYFTNVFSGHIYSKVIQDPTVIENYRKNNEAVANIITNGGRIDTCTIVWNINNEEHRVRYTFTEDDFSVDPEDGVISLITEPREAHVRTFPFYSVENCYLKTGCDQAKEWICYQCKYPIYNQTINESFGEVPVNTDQLVNTPRTKEVTRKCSYLIYS